MDNTLGNALVVEVLRLLDQQMILDQYGTTFIGLQRVFIVSDDQSMLAGHRGMGVPSLLMQLSAVPYVLMHLLGIDFALHVPCFL